MKIKTVYRCQECGYANARWLGRCPECNNWNSFVEEQEASIPKSVASKHRVLTDFSSDVVTLESGVSRPVPRKTTGIPEMDRVVGGGIVPGSLLLLGGAPGIGKSTLMLQVAVGLANESFTGLYVSGEESLQQVQDRAHRLGLHSNHLSLLSETELGKVTDAVQKLKPAFCVIDSIQTTYRQDLASAPGSVGQVRECAAELLRLAKSQNMAIFLLGHVTKDGDLAGPRVLEHIVDTVLYFESEREQLFRLLRAHKNRFGSTHEMGVFRMTEKGLAGVARPSELFLQERSKAPGVAIVGSLEGNRPLLLEVQALVSRTHFGFPKRMVTGYDLNRSLLLIAVLEKRCGLHLESEDIFVNIVGGLKIKEPAVDLGMAMAIASAFRNAPLDPETIWIGEVGLGGEVRSVAGISERIAEAEALGFKRVILPAGNQRELESQSNKWTVERHPVQQVSQALEWAERK